MHLIQDSEKLVFSLRCPFEGNGLEYTAAGLVIFYQNGCDV